MAASFGYILNQLNFGLLPFGYELWVNTTSIQIFGNRRLKVSCVDIERLFKMSALQRTRTGRQVCRCLEEETECDQDVSHALIARCFRRECSCLCGGSEMNLPILFRTRTGRPTSRDRPCQSRTLLHCLDMLYHSEIYKIKTS